MHNKGGSRIFALIASVTALQVTGFVLLDQQRGGAGLASRKAWQWSAARSTRTMEAPPLPPVEQQEATAPPFAHSVYLPLRDSAWSNDHRQKMEAILRDIAGSTAFFVDPVVAASNDHAAVAWYWACQIPAFGDACSLRLDLQLATSTNTPPRLVLSMPGHDTPSRADEDFGWLCTKFYEYYDELDAVVDCSAHLLDRVLVQHSNCDAATFAWSAAQLASFERMLQHGYGRKNDRVDDAIRCFIDHLETFGYSIIDCDPSTTPTPTTHDQNDAAFTLHTTAAQQSQLSDYYLHEASSQGPTVRTDRVHFLSRSEAESCGIAAQYDLLMGLAHLLNDHLPSSPRHSSPYLQPVFPATVERPLALPRSLQFAEYAHGDYYVAHSDNALTDKVTPDGHPIRVNFRAYTCILYMNDNNWDMVRDGGALRLVPNKRDVNWLGEATALVPDISVDIAPINGRLLIFDSRLVHSVQPVTSTTKKRRALTLWIHKPNNSDVHADGKTITTTTSKHRA